MLTSGRLQPVSLRAFVGPGAIPDGTVPSVGRGAVPDGTVPFVGRGAVPDGTAIQDGRNESLDSLYLRPALARSRSIEGGFSACMN